MKYFYLYKYSFWILCVLFFSHALSAADVTFKVDMRQETVSSAGVFIAGDFQQEAGFAQDWNPALLWQKTNVSDGDVMDFSHFSEGNYILRLSDASGKVANQMLTIVR